jgi:hypothetical protein
MCNLRDVASCNWKRKSATTAGAGSTSESGLKGGIEASPESWHTRPLKVGNQVFRDYFAAGNGGQQVIIIPDLDMVIGFTGGDYSERDKFFRWEIQLVPQYIIPVALGQVH